MYEDTKLPVIEDWLGSVLKQHQTCIHDILDATVDLGNLHEYWSTNPKMYTVKEYDEAGHNQDNVFKHYTCFRFYCQFCNELNHFSTPPTPERLQQIKEVLGLQEEEEEEQQEEEEEVPAATLES